MCAALGYYCAPNLLLPTFVQFYCLSIYLSTLSLSVQSQTTKKEENNGEIKVNEAKLTKAKAVCSPFFLSFLRLFYTAPDMSYKKR